MDQTSATTPAQSAVRFGSQIWRLDTGSSVTFGRSGDCDIVIPRQGKDLLVSRRAGRLTAVDGGLLLSNESMRNSVFMRAIPGPEIEIKPLTTVGTMPFSRCRIVIFGSDTARYVLEITCGIGEGSSASKALLSETGATGEPTTFGYWRMDIPDAQRRYLAALCEPILTGVGARTAPATYNEIAQRCGVSRKTVRNSLDALRQQLSSECGIPGLVHLSDSNQEAPGTTNFLSALAAWAVHSGTITLNDLEAIDR